MDTKISIIIPAYNVAGYLEPCLDSMLAQTFSDFEIVVVDDGSTDDTPQICDRYAEKDSRITVIHKKNEGVSIARNTGVEIAKGKYFLFFDGDDFAEPETCEELYALAEERQADTILYGYHRYNAGVITETSYPIFPEGLYEGEAIVPQLVSRFVGFSWEGINQWLRREKNGLYVENPALWRAMVSARIIRENGLLFDKNLRVGEDTVFISDYLSCSRRCYVHHKCYYYLVTRETSTIYQYEKNALAKLEGKTRLLTARNELTDRVLERTGIDIRSYWQGTVVMSCIELAFLFSRSSRDASYGERYRRFLEYARLPDVQKSVRDFPLSGSGVRAVPFLLLRWGWTRVLFLCAWLLNRVHYEFQRG